MSPPWGQRSREEEGGFWQCLCPFRRSPQCTEPVQHGAGWMPGKADHRVIAATANEALRLIKKRSRTQKHNEEPVYQSIGGHEYANKSLNYIPAASTPALAQPWAGGGPDGHQNAFVLLSSWLRTKWGYEGTGRAVQPPLQCSPPSWY